MMMPSGSNCLKHTEEKDVYILGYWQGWCWSVSHPSVAVSDWDHGFHSDIIHTLQQVCVVPTKEVGSLMGKGERLLYYWSHGFNNIEQGLCRTNRAEHYVHPLQTVKLQFLSQSAHQLKSHTRNALRMRM